MEHSFCKHCGYTSDNHHFRHQYEEIKCVITDGNIVVNANKFKEHEKFVCKKLQCSYSKNMHNTIMCEHSFDSEQILYRKINITIPLRAVCIICKKNLSSHEKFEKITERHLFTMGVDVLNKRKHDIIDLINPLNDEIKINSIISS